ncbi:NADH:flavin oxidoreductase/NADH oxidase [Gulosibacter macacae]|uniref:NADH:flavin oxidoreductase/NADH oxidase n=1 Tax=Gulosibacter macacae TaxID=2488791 RepID=A0A3P3VWZ9_9MICO|nr:NADH:flavin oxidoreductase/NADH oxidase [Gulosibacter macacae]RRJ87220.1 NADH:flavin oxidoreductase/NADH oxidase [Gulosibacter macacae]
MLTQQESAPVRLFDPITLRGIEFRNRLWVSPMCMYAVDAEDGVPTDWHLVHLPAMARGGAGLVVMEATGVVPEGRISPRCPGLWNDAQEQQLARIAELVHASGGKLAIQLAHAGRKASTEPWLPEFTGATVPEAEGGWQTVAPSAIAFDGLATPRALTSDEIAELVAAFAAAADRAVAAGLDAVELHGAHGYLIHEFLSPFSNEREDEYGGALENRARFLLEIVRSIRAAHPELPLIVRISASEWLEDGFDLSEAKQLAAWLGEAGVDLIDVSSGGNTGSAPIPVGPAYQAPLAGIVREAGVPVSTVGQINDAATAQTVLTLGQADVITVGRAWLRNPYLALNWANDLRADVSSYRPEQLWRAFPAAKRR